MTIIVEIISIVEVTAPDAFNQLLHLILMHIEALRSDACHVPALPIGPVPVSALGIPAAESFAAEAIQGDELTYAACGGGPSVCILPHLPVALDAWLKFWGLRPVDVRGIESVERLGAHIVAADKLDPLVFSIKMTKVT